MSEVSEVSEVLSPGFNISMVTDASANQMPLFQFRIVGTVKKAFLLQRKG